MFFAVVGVVIAFNVSLYLVLATFLKDTKRKASTVEFPELKGTPFVSLSHILARYIVLVIAGTPYLKLACPENKHYVSALT